MSEDLQLKHIRAQADALGIKYHHKAGVTKIQEAIEAHLEKERADELLTPAKPKLPKGKIVPVTEAEYKDKLRAENRRKVGALIHCRIQCMNPNKKDWPGEIISVGSAKLGTFKKYIPFNNEPYHIPKIIYDMLKEKKCSQFYNTTDMRGNKTRKARQINEYAIEVLDPLTPEELKDLARRQAMAAGTTAQ